MFHASVTITHNLFHASVTITHNYCNVNYVYLILKQLKLHDFISTIRKYVTQHVHMAILFHYYVGAIITIPCVWKRLNNVCTGQMKPFVTVVT